MILLIGEAVKDDTTPTWRSAMKVLLGCAILSLGAKSAKQALSGAEKATSGWMSKLDQMGPQDAAGLGLLLTTVNPKNLLLAIAAAGVIVDSGIPGARQAAAYLAFSLLASTGVAIPLVVDLSMGQRAPDVLARFKGWMAKHSAKIMAVVLGLLGAALLWQGVSGLLG